jgi:hypothetical protein
MVEPSHQFQGRHFQCILGFPWCTVLDQFGLVQPIDRLDQGVDLAVATAEQRGLYPGLGQALCEKNRNILRTRVRLKYKFIRAFGLPVKQVLLQRIEHKVRAQ